jgi:hypothetical protein
MDKLMSVVSLIGYVYLLRHRIHLDSVNYFKYKFMQSC